MVRLIERGEAAGSDDYSSDPLFQYRSVPSLITGAEFRYDAYDKNLFRYGSRPTNQQEAVSF
ncbi:MAG: hypothetical protein SGJ16_01435 [Nitrospirota bacterium]|nr:hypothetical protein [Nitrospirota bacterium]